MEFTNFKTGDIILFHTPVKWYSPMSWLAGLIRVFTKCRYNHVGVVILNWGVPFLNEATATGVTTMPLKDRFGDSPIRILRYNNPIKEDTFAIKANDKVGHTGYDFSGLLWFQLIYQLTGHWLGHTGAAAEGKMYCGEYAAWMFPKAFPEPWKTAPSVIYNSTKFKVKFEGMYKIN